MAGFCGVKKMASLLTADDFFYDEKITKFYQSYLAIPLHYPSFPSIY